MSETREQDTELRLQAILAAKREFSAFLSQCEQFQLLHPVVVGTFRRITNDEHIDPSLLRGEKIEQKRQEMVLWQKVKTMQAAADSARHTTCVPPLNTHTCSPRKDPQQVLFHAFELVNIHAGDDEEVQRDLWIAKVKHATIKSVQAIAMLLQEVPMLEMRVQKESRQRCCSSEDPTAPCAFPAMLLQDVPMLEMRVQKERRQRCCRSEDPTAPCTVSRDFLLVCSLLHLI